jgi:hypothetical protein
VHKGIKEPHLFNAATNPQRMIRNLVGILDEAELDKIRREIDANVIGLYRLAEGHFVFAKAIKSAEWRQKISRLYYAAYNARRAISLKNDGSYTTDSTDHQKVDVLPDRLDNHALYKSKLKDLRDDRNLADYNHLAKESDLLVSVFEAEKVVTDFINDAKKFLTNLGIII